MLSACLFQAEGAQQPPGGPGHKPTSEEKGGRDKTWASLPLPCIPKRSLKNCSRFSLFTCAPGSAFSPEGAREVVHIEWVKASCSKSKLPVSTLLEGLGKGQAEPS